MKVAATLVIFFAATASAFGLHNGATSAVKSMAKAGFASKPMVQAVDVNGNRLNTAVSSNLDRKPTNKQWNDSPIVGNKCADDWIVSLLEECPSSWH
jgi:hypothetical protein